MKKTKLFLCLTLLASATASADPCVTSSRGLMFFNGSFDTNTSSSAAVGACQAISFTSNAECQANLRCGFGVANPYPSGYVDCTTASKGLRFDQRNANVQDSVSGVLNQCINNSVTSNQECQANLSCRDASMAPIASGRAACFTRSHNLEFHGESRSVDDSSGAVMSECTNNSVTSNLECQYNLRCEPNFNGPILSQTVGCTTSSKGLPFRASGVGMNNTSSAALSQCVNNQYTSNIECQSNLSCRYIDMSQPPVVVQPPVIGQPPVVVLPQPPVVIVQPPRAWGCSLFVRPAPGINHRYPGTGIDQPSAAMAALELCLRSDTPFACHHQATEQCRPL